MRKRRNAMDQLIDNLVMEGIWKLEEEVNEILVEELDEIGEKSLFFDGNRIFIE